MALVKCSDCGTDRSDQVGSACPNCGNIMEFDPGPMPIAPPKVAWLGLLHVFICLVLFVAGMGLLSDLEVVAYVLFIIAGGLFVFSAITVMIPHNLRCSQYRKDLEQWEAMGPRMPRVSPPKEGSRIKPVVGFVHPLKSNESNEDGGDGGGDSGGGDGGTAGFTGMV